MINACRLWLFGLLVRGNPQIGECFLAVGRLMVSIRAGPEKWPEASLHSPSLSRAEVSLWSARITRTGVIPVKSGSASLATTRDIAAQFDQLLIETDALDRPLADKLVWLTARAREIAPDLMAAEDRMILRLIAADAARKSPRCGAPLPAFALPDKNGAIVDLPSVLSTGPAVIMINRGHWCPYDQLQLRDLAQALPLLGEGRIGAVAIMPEGKAFAALLAEVDSQPVKVLSDASLGYALSLGLVTRAGEEMIGCLLDLGIDLPRICACPNGLIAMPATFVVDGDGIVRASFDCPDFRQRIALVNIEIALRRPPTADRGHPAPNAVN